jgi:hypothetical protein
VINKDRQRSVEDLCQVAVWNLKTRKVIQTASLGEHSGALIVHFLQKPGVRRAFINAPGTGTVWLAADDDRDGRFDFQQVLGQRTGSRSRWTWRCRPRASTCTSATGSATPFSNSTSPTRSTRR